MANRESKFEKVKRICKDRGILFPAAKIYGGVSGFYTYGPLGVKLKENVKDHIRDNLLEWDNIHEVSNPIIFPKEVWEASGHVGSFTDPLIQCKKCGERHRADHLIEDKLKQKAEHLSKEEMKKIIKEEDIKCPSCGGNLGEVKNFQLMFKTHIGPTIEESSEAFLRPECATPGFLSYKRVRDSMREKLPFGIAQFGKCYRNEISPRNFIFRMREFTLMDLEFLIHPKEKDEIPKEKWEELKDIETRFLSVEKEKNDGKAEKMSFEEAWNKDLFVTEWQALWMARIIGMLKKAGIPEEKMRFRQHMPEERSHYAADQWDCEVKFSFGWKEVCGSHDRTQYDLKRHEKYGDEELKFYDQEREEKVRPYTIETSPGIDRIVYALLETSYEEDGDRVYLSIDPKLAPIKVAVFPLVQKDGLPEKAKEVYRKVDSCFEAVYDDSGSIGKRYYRWDEVGVPLAVTCDYDTLEKKDVTIRSRDTTDQVRVSIKNLNKILKKLLEGEIEFGEVGKPFN